MRKRLQKIEITNLTGLVFPTDWDEGGARSLSLYTFDEDEYLIDMNSVGKRLFKFIQKPVEVFGTIHYKSDKKHVSVSKFVPFNCW